MSVKSAGGTTVAAVLMSRIIVATIAALALSSLANARAGSQPSFAGTRPTKQKTTSDACRQRVTNTQDN
jgi:hypothetical protein